MKILTVFSKATSRARQSVHILLRAIARYRWQSVSAGVIVLLSAGAVYAYDRLGPEPHARAPHQASFNGATKEAHTVSPTSENPQAQGTETASTSTPGQTPVAPATGASAPTARPATPATNPANPYHIVLSVGSTEVTPGAVSATITASSSDGRAVVWSASSLGEQLLISTDMVRVASSPSYTFRVVGGAKAAAGSYSLPVSAYDPRSGSRANTSLSVTVKAPRSFEISLGAENVHEMLDGINIYVPLTITRTGGHEGWLSTSAYLTAAPSSDHGVSCHVSMSSTNYGEVIIHVPNDAPAGSYTVAVSITDGSISRTQYIDFDI